MTENRLWIDEPVFDCEECAVRFVQSQLRLWRLNDSWPELMVCPKCEKKLKASPISNGLFRICPRRFNRTDRQVICFLVKQSRKAAAEKIALKNARVVAKAKAESVRAAKRAKRAARKTAKLKASVKAWAKAAMKRTTRIEKKLKRAK